MKYLFVIILSIYSLIIRAEEIKEKKCNFVCKSIISITFSLAFDEKIREISQEKKFKLKEEISKYFEPIGRRSFGFYLSGSSFLFSILLKDSKMEKLAFELLETNILCDFSVNLFQKGFGRERPKKSGGNPYKFFKGGNSFPSSHSLHSWALAYTLNKYYPKYKLVFFAFPFFVSLSRVLDDHHWVSDVVSGAVFGIISSKFVHKLNKKYSKFLFYPIMNKDRKAIALRIFI